MQPTVRQPSQKVAEISEKLEQDQGQVPFRAAIQQAVSRVVTTATRRGLQVIPVSTRNDWQLLHSWSLGHRTYWQHRLGSSLRMSAHHVSMTCLCGLRYIYSCSWTAWPPIKVENINVTVQSNIGGQLYTCQLVTSLMFVDWSTFCVLWVFSVYIKLTRSILEYPSLQAPHPTHISAHTNTHTPTNTHTNTSTNTHNNAQWQSERDGELGLRPWHCVNIPGGAYKAGHESIQLVSTFTSVLVMTRIILAAVQTCEGL